MEAHRRTLGTAWLLAVPMLLRCIFVVISEKRKKNRSSQKEELAGESAVFLHGPPSQEWGWVLTFLWHPGRPLQMDCI